jgi:hypothetical protein
VTAAPSIVPSYQMAGRMECSTQNGECVDDVQCNGSQQQQQQQTQKDNGVPPVPPITQDNGPAVP